MKKIISLTTAVLLLLSLCLPVYADEGLADAEFAEYVIQGVAFRSESAYQPEAYGESAVLLKPETECVEWLVEIPVAATYDLGFTYCLQEMEGFGKSPELFIQMDGQDLFPATAGFSLNRWWKDEKPTVQKENANESASEQTELLAWTTQFVSDDTAIYENFPLYLEAGTHTIRIAVNVPVALEAIRLRTADAPSYEIYYVGGETEAQENAGATPIVIEGEKAVRKNSAYLAGMSEANSAAVQPHDSKYRKINYIGGEMWSQPGDEIVWDFEVEKAGYYALSVRYLQTYILNGSVYRRLKIDGKVPFAEADSVVFPYEANWTFWDYKNKGDELLYVYLTEGSHQISLTATLGQLKTIPDRLSAVVGSLGSLYTDMTMITGETVDTYRDYELFAQIPDMEEVLTTNLAELEKISEEIQVISQAGSNTYISLIGDMTLVMRNMLANKYTAHRYKGQYYEKFCALSGGVSDIKKMPLAIDQIVLTPKGTEYGAREVSFWESFVYTMQRFFFSFSDDYASLSETVDDENTVTVWVGWGRDQAQALSALIQDSFTPKTGIPVNLVVTNTSLFQGMISGNTPDCMLNVTRSEPVNLAMRGALLDLDRFLDLNEVKGRFTETACVPYMYQDKTYAIPDTQTFMTMFYRTDVFEEMGLEVPQTWDEFIAVATILQRKNLQSYLLCSPVSDLTALNNGIGALYAFPTLMIQNDVPLYTADQRCTTLMEAATAEIFTAWTDMYTQLKMPVSMDFLNRFRLGTAPMGVTTYTLYSTLVSTAPEIAGKWAIAPIPGTEKNGVIDRSQAGAGTGCVILKDAKNPEATWEFLKWWTSADTQLRYSNRVEAILGAVGRIATSNMEAFSRMSWEGDTEKLLEQWQTVDEMPEVPGGYYVGRAIDQAFWNVVDSPKENPKDMLLKWGAIANNEIRRKSEQYERNE